MSLFGAKKSEPLKDVLKRAKENFEKKMMESTSPSEASAVSSSHIGEVLDRHLDLITGPPSSHPEVMQGSSELAREEQLREFHGTAEYESLRAGEKHVEFEMGLHRARIEDELRRCENDQATPRVESEQLPSDLDDMKAYSDLTGKTGVTGIARYGSNESLELSPPPTTSYGGSEISFPSQTPRERVLSPLPSTNYEGSLLGLPLSALPEDPFSVPRTSSGIIVQRYIRSEENTSQHATAEEGMEETWKVYTPIQRKVEISDDSERSDDAMTEVEWRDETPYMTPTKKGKKCNKRKGVKRPAMPEQPIPNMPQMPRRRKLESDWAKPADTLASEDEPADLGKFFGECLRNTNGLRDFMVGQENNDANYDVWCQNQSQHIAVRQNHTDAAVMSIRKIALNVQVEIEQEREYSAERAEKLDERLSKIEKRLAKIAPVNMAKTIENAMSDCMEKMVEQVMDQVVGKLEKLDEKEKREEIRRGKQVEATPEDEDRSDMEFQPGATFSEEENGKVAIVIERMQVDEQELEALKLAPVIPLGEKRQEFPRFTPSGQVTIAKRPEIAPAVPEQTKKEGKKPKVKDAPHQQNVF